MRIKKLLFYLLAALLAGCLPVMSLHPLYNEENLVFEEKLLGVWVDDSNETVWEFKRSEKHKEAYKLFFSDDKGNKGLFIAHFVMIEDMFFLDVYAESLPSGNPDDPNSMEWPYNMFFFVTARTFIKVNPIESNTLKMRLTDDDDMEKLLKEDPDAVKHELVDDKLILTASTEELQAFVLKYADDSRVFTNEIVLSRKKTEDPNDPNAIDPNQTDPNSIDPNDG